MLVEIIKFLFYSFLIVIISKYILVTYLRKLAESLHLKAKVVGDIAGYATSVPELLTITTSSLRGFMGASVYNILSSNIINLVQYLGTIIINKNTNKLKNHAIKIDIILVAITIIIPILLLRFNIKMDMFIIPSFIILFALFTYLNNNVHKYYLNIEDDSNNEYSKGNKKKAIVYILVLIITGILLYIIGELLGNSLESLCNIFSIPEAVIGVLLGIITSIPELITFFESQKHHKKSNDDMLGVVEATNNLLSSNILNLFVIQTIGILIINMWKFTIIYWNYIQIMI